MEYKSLGKSGIKISTLCFGCMSLGEDQQQNTVLLHQALDQGINFFDTADLYQFGENEISVGKAFKEKREKIIIATKVGNEWNSARTAWSWNPTKAYILSAVDKSLKRLQTDYIDLYQLHGGTIDDPIDDTIEAFELLKAKGKIRAYGISSIRPNVIRTYVEKATISSVMMQYSLLDRRPEETCLSLLASNTISVLSRGSLAKGLLTGKHAKPYLAYSEEEVKKMAEKVGSLAKKLNISPAQLALKFVLANEAISTAVTGIRTKGQLDDILGTNRVKNVNEENIQLLQQVLEAKHYEAHR